MCAFIPLFLLIELTRTLRLELEVSVAKKDVILAAEKLENQTLSLKGEPLKGAQKLAGIKFVPVLCRASSVVATHDYTEGATGNVLRYCFFASLGLS